MYFIFEELLVAEGSKERKDFLRTVLGTLTQYIIGHNSKIRKEIMYKISKEFTIVEVLNDRIKGSQSYFAIAYSKISDKMYLIHYDKMTGILVSDEIKSIRDTLLELQNYYITNN